MEKPRQIALRILQRHAEGSEYAEDLLSAELKKQQLAPNDRALVHELVCGIIRFQRTLDWIIEQKTDGRPQQPIIRTLLHLGLYQLLWLDRIPSHAAVHETVELAKDLKLGPISGFVNAVLRGVARELPQFREKLAELETVLPEVRHSHPAWLCRRWENRYGKEHLLTLLRWNNAPPPVFARHNSLRGDVASLESAWTQEGVRFTRREFPWASKLNLNIYELLEHPSLTSLPSFQSGLFYIQDPSTLFAVAELQAQPGETILDLCSAPGGKTTLIAQCMQNQGRIIAQDTHRARMELVRQNCTRLGVNCVRISSTTGITHPELSIAFDRILVDAPCSNSGVMRRRVDLRWRITPEEIQRLQVTQQELMKDAAVQLKSGGTLVYSTCSLEPEENQAVTKWFLSQHPEFRCAKETQLTPFGDGVDGAYIAQFIKR